MRRLFSFPDRVDEVSARLVAAGVVLQCVLFLVTHERLLLIPLAYGFVARVATGPKLSPLGQFVTRVATPALDLTPRPVPGPPKRFAQGIGATLSMAALISAFGFTSTGTAMALVALILVAASLESAAGFCLGCKIFALLMSWGIVAPDACEACNDLTVSQRAAATTVVDQERVAASMR